MAYDDVPLGGLASLELDERIPFDSAIDASDCYLDLGGITGRNGYRAATASAVGSGTVQALARFRPDASNARTIQVRGGQVNVVADPSSETASDGAVTNLATVFGSGVKVSAAQLGKYLYLGPDSGASTSEKAWRRVKPDFTLETLTDIPKGATPTVSRNSLSFVKFTSLTETLSGAPAAAGATVQTDWRQISGAVGAYVTYDLGTDQVWSNVKWLFIAASPETQTGGGGKFVVEIATSGGSFETLDTVYDGPGDGSPYAVYFNLNGVTSATRAAVRRIRFRQALGSDPFCVHGYMAVPSAPARGDVKYFVDFYNSSTLQQSVPTEQVTVTYSGDTVVIPQFHAARWLYNSFVDVGTRSADPDTLTIDSLFNIGVGLTVPAHADFATTATFAGNGPSAAVGAYDTARLWRISSGGTRLVKTQTIAVAGAYSITDDVGDAALANVSYKAGGSPPLCSAMAGVAGRLLAGGDPSTPNRLYCSSYLPFGQTTDPFPQFPAVPTIAADGWAVDISPTAAEQILWLGELDNKAYIGTNERMIYLPDLSAPIDGGAPPLYTIASPGVIGRQAACWTDTAVYWAGTDGVYFGRGTAFGGELTKSIRRLYASWLLPDSTTVVRYQDQKLLVIRGTRYLRFDFVTQRWTRGTLAHTHLFAAAWHDPGGTINQLWLLDSAGQIDRWQASATTDRGSAIAAWTFSTGFNVDGQKNRGRSFYLDSTGAGTVSLYSDMATTGPSAKTVASGEKTYTFGVNTAYKWRIVLTAANTVVFRRLMIEREGVDAR